MISALLRIGLITGLLPAFAFGGEVREAWLGVRIVPVPTSLASQLALDEAGLMVINVVRDSPADQAGIEQYDVLLRFNDQDVPPDDRDFSEMVRGTEVDKPVDIELIRQGKKQTVEVKLAGLGEDTPFDYKYDVEPDIVGEEELRFGGKLLDRDPAGRWRLRDLGDITQLPEPFRRAVPRSIQRRSIKLEAEEIKIEITEDGNRIHVHLREDGKIEVTKSKSEQDQEEEAETHVYENMDDLRRGDQRAYTLLQDARGRRGGGRFQFRLDHPYGSWWLDKTAPWPWEEHFESHIRKSLEKAEKSMAEARKKAADAIADRPELDIASRDLRRLFEGFFRGQLDDDRESASFSTTEDGKIEVRVRKGDDELTLTFKNEEDLAARKPKLHERYQELQQEIE